MPLFLCDECGVIENTALSSYWSRKEYADEKALCSECAPKSTWHGKFPREFMTAEQIAEQTDWSGWVECERLKTVLAAYRERQKADREAREQAGKEATAAKAEAHRKATTSPYPLSILRMPNGSKSQRRAKKHAKDRFIARQIKEGDATPAA
jgi:hypothetical protein